MSQKGIEQLLGRALLLEMMKRLEKTTEKLQEAVIWGIEASSLDEKEFL